MSKLTEQITDSTDWMCARCGRELSSGKVNLEYMGVTFTPELLRCESCGMVFVPEDLAVGKMAEVEMVLEDK